MTNQGTDWKAQESRYYMHVVNRQPVVIERGNGARVWDVDGKEYLDFTAGWAVVNLGHNHPAVTKAIQEQAETLLQTSNQFYTLPQLQLAEALVENSSLDKVFFSNDSGETFVLRAGPTFDLLHVNSLGEQILASPALVGGRWYFRTGRNLYAIGQSS